MSNILNFVSSIGADLKDKITNTIVDLTGTHSHNMIDPSTTNCVVRNPSLPLCSSIPKGSLELGTLITLSGTISSTFGKRFRIDFIAGKCEHTRDKTEQPVPSNVAFHFNPRFNGGDAAGDVVVMNSRLDNAWGDEQREQSFPFGIQQPFNMMILVEEDSFKIAVNGKHMYEFKHRVPYNSIGCIHIEGDIEINTIEFRKELKYLNSSGSSSSSNNWCDRIKAKLIPSPPVPYTEFDVRLGKEFTMYVAGKLPNICNRFFVLNLAASGNNFPVHTIPFHLSIRPQERVMVRNSFENGDWKSEERSIEGEFPLIPGAHFDMMICNKPDILTVAANGQMVFEFRHRMNPSIIDTVEINGSVELSSVRYEFYE